ncbi:MAG: ATP-dependent helicase [Acidobacteriota bacterium]
MNSLRTRPEAAALLAHLNPEQRSAVTHTGGACLVLAGAGSGKTRVLTRRIAYLIAERGVPPNSICAVTFTNKAAAEMRARVRSLLGEQPEGLWLSTFHALGLRLLREWAGRHGAPPAGFAIYNRDSSLAVWRQCQHALQVSASEYEPARLYGRCSRAVNRLEDPAAWDEKAASWNRRVAGRIWKEYRRAMEEAAAVDFDDLLYRPLKLLSANAELRAAVQQRFRHLLVDEYQDTNRLQYRLVRSLLGAPEDHELMVVGDEDQSIYRWRGADLNNVLDFQDDFPGATLIRLERNYRSTRPILAAASSLVSHNHQRLGKKLWTEEEGGELPLFVQCATDRQEAEWAVSKVAALVAADVALSGIAILYRTNAQSRLLEEAFLARRIAHRVVGGPRFFARAEVRDLLAYLLLLVRPDDVALRRAVAVPSRGIGPATLEALAGAQPQMGAAAALQHLASQPAPADALRATACPTAVIPRLLAFHRMLEELRRLAATVSIENLIRATLDRSGYAATLAARPDAGDRLANLEELISAATEEIDHGPSGNGLAELAAFLDRVALLTDADTDQGSTGGVRLMTVHAAKGLEFEVVFLCGMEEGLFPHASALAEGQVEEERRLCYVGMTRARRRLLLSAAHSRRLYGRERWQEPSRFIAEINPSSMIVHNAPIETTTVSGASRRAGTVPRQGDATASAERTTRAAPAKDLHVGVRVRHPIFGLGKVTWCQGSGKGLKLKIRFAAGSKTILARYAKLEVFR